MSRQVPGRYEYVVGDTKTRAVWIEGDYSAGPARMVWRRSRSDAADPFVDLDDDPGGGLVVTLLTDTTIDTSAGEVTRTWTKVAYTFTVTSAMVGRGEWYLEVAGAERLRAEWVTYERGVPA